jgi:hypothetical protein
VVSTLAVLLTSTTTTTIAKSTSTHVTPLAIVVALAGLAVGYGLAYLRRKRKGNPPWRLHPALWGIFVALTDGVALILLAIAWFTTNDKLPARPSRYGRLGQPVNFRAMQGTQMGTATNPQPPGAMLPGTYGTSLPPHLQPNGKSPDGNADLDFADASTGTTSSAVSAANKPAGWRTDPTGRHEHRYWSGSAWTKHVSDEGTRSIDPL